MAVNETIVTGRKYRTLIDEANKLWQRISFWHKASDCEFDDGDTAETKVGAVKGITTDFNTTETGYAADMTTVSKLNRSLTNEDSETFNFGVKDGVRGYFTNPSRADDSFIPFKSGGSIKLLTTVNTATTINMSSHMSDYKSLDASNFLCVVDGGWADSGVGEGKNLSSTPTLAPVAQATFTPAALSYDPTTGELSITPAKLSGTGGIKYTNDHSWYKVTHCNTNLSTTVYLVE